MSWQDNEHSLLDLDDPAPHPNRPIQQRQHQPSPSNDPFASNRPSISYDDFAGQGSSTSHRPYPLAQSTSNISVDTLGTASGTFPQQSYFDDVYNDDLINRNTQRSRRSIRESGGSVIGGFIGRVTGGLIGGRQQ